MSRTLAAQLLNHCDEPVVLEGWVHRRRRHAAVTFLVLRDRSGLAQVVATDEHARGVIDSLGEETVVRVAGMVVENDKAPGGAELINPTITMLSDVAATPPFELWRPTLNVSLPVMLDNAPIAWRHPAQQAVWRIAASSLQGFRAALDAQGFTEIQTPKLVGSSTESGATSSSSTTSDDRPTWPSPHSSTSRRWWASSKGSTKSGQSFVLNRTTRSVISPNTCP